MQCTSTLSSSLGYGGCNLLSGSYTAPYGGCTLTIQIGGGELGGVRAATPTVEGVVPPSTSPFGMMASPHSLHELQLEVQGGRPIAVALGVGPLPFIRAQCCLLWQGGEGGAVEGPQVCTGAMLAPRVEMHPMVGGTPPRYMREGGAHKAQGGQQGWGVTGEGSLPPPKAGGTPLRPLAAMVAMGGMGMRAV